MDLKEKKLLYKEIDRYIQDNNYYNDGTVKTSNIWLVGWIADELSDRKDAMRILINNEYGLLGNLLYKHVLNPDSSVTAYIEEADRKFIVKAIKNNPGKTIYQNKFDGDPYAIKLLIQYDKKYAKYMDAHLAARKSFVESIIVTYPEVLNLSPKKILDDEEFILSLVKKNHLCLQCLPKKYLSDYDICLEAVKREGYSLMWLDLNIKNHDEIVLEAVKNRGNALSIATSEQKKNRQIVMAAISNFGGALEYADESFRHDYDIVLKAVSTTGMALRSAAPELAFIKEIVEAAVKNDGYAIKFAPEEYRDDYETAKLALRTYPDAYKYLSERLKKDPELVKIYNESKVNYTWLLSKMQRESVKE